MTWESFVPKYKTGITIGCFTVRDLGTGALGMPKLYEGKKHLIFVDKKRGIVKIAFGDKGREQRTLGTSWLKEIIGENSCIAYHDEDEMYLSPYSKGEEYLRKVLLELKIKV